VLTVVEIIVGGLAALGLGFAFVWALGMLGGLLFALEGHPLSDGPPVGTLRGSLVIRFPTPLMWTEEVPRRTLTARQEGG
jgi:hypothetical protein